MANFNLNKAILGGRLTAEPELKQTPSGVMVLSFSVAVDRRFQSRGEDGQMGQRQADFINCVAWRQTAEFISRYFHKGSSICLVGSIQTRSWNDQQGNKRYTTEVVVDEAYFVDSKSENPGGYQQAGAQAYMPSAYSAPAPQYATPAGQAPASQGGAAPQFEVLENDDELPF